MMRRTLWCALCLALAQTCHAGPITYSAPYAGGLGYLPTFGEVFTAQAGNPVLDSFSFYLQVSGTGPYTFSGYVYNWNGSAVTGSALFSGNGTTTTSPYSGDGYYSFFPNLTLVAGQRYIAMLSWPTGWAEGSACGTQFTIDCPTNPSPLTQFVKSTTLTEAAWQNASSWSTLGGRVAFSIQVGDTPSGVPEPATLPLALLGGGMVVLLRSRAGRCGGDKPVTASK